MGQNWGKYLFPVFLQKEKAQEMAYSLDFLTGAEGLEPSTCGFGDRYSTN